MTEIQILDDTPRELGEGPLWHPERQQFFWFDILEKRLCTRTGDGPRHWLFDEHVSAAGWIDRNSVLIASETALFSFDLVSGDRETLAPLEANRAETRSNDGRADPAGGFWIGTMGKGAEKDAGAIYRFHGGELHMLFPEITIPNAICFAPGGDRAYFCDTPLQRIMTVALDDEGWPAGEPDLFADTSGYNPDGAVCDADGNIWNAQFGAGRIAVYTPMGQILQIVDLPAAHPTCPAFGGPDLTDLYCTSALEHLPEDLRNAADGCTFRLPGAGKGQAEHRVLL